MAKTRGAHSFRPRVRQGPSPSTIGSSTAGPVAAGPAAVGPSAGFISAGPSVAAVGAGPSMPAARPTAAPTPASIDAEGSSSMTPAQGRYHTRVGPTLPASSHPRPARRAPPSKRGLTSGLGESSTSRSRAPPSPPYQGIAEAPDLSPGSIIRQPYFPCDPIPGNVSCRDRDFHGRCTTISPHLPRTQGSETLCSSYSNTIWSHSWCRVSTIILGSSPSSIIR